jgi:uncharacterized protein YbbC (DUF1343 family)
MQSSLANPALKKLSGKRLGLITNQTGIAQDFRPTAQVLEAVGGKVTALFGAEHGYYGVVQDAIAIEAAQTDPATGLPIYSLYRQHDYGLGNTVTAFNPPPDSLANLDALVYDIQDIGTRYYTFTTTLGILLEEVDLPIYVIDRPNPLGGQIIEGGTLEPELSSFVGRYPEIPVRHGLTGGELALFINRFLLNQRAKLEVIPMHGWQRSMSWEDTGLVWVAPSPNMPSVQTARLYPGTCLLEGTNLSVGRGTTQPFELFGADWLKEPAKLAQELNALQLAEVYFRETFFQPWFDRYSGLVCGGVQVHILPGAAKNTPQKSVQLGLQIVAMLKKLYPQEFAWQADHFDRLIGSSAPRELIEKSGGDVTKLVPLFEQWAIAEAVFRQKRQEILLY